MVHLYRIVAKVSILACFFVGGTAWADTTLMDRVGALFDDIGRGFNFVGKKASDLVGPGLELGQEAGETVSFTRAFEERYPVGLVPVVSVASEFGEVRVTTWPNQVVQVSAQIVVSAESGEQAQRIAESTDIQVTHAEDRVEAHTRLPDTREEQGRVSISVNYTLIVPDDASLIVENYFGDTIVKGVGGTAAVNAQYGLVDVRDIAGPVRVRMYGEFSLEAHGLRSGGSFELNGAHSVISDVAGKLKVDNFRGSIELKDIAPETELDISSESGPIVLHLPENAAPDLVATSLFGKIESDMELGETQQGSFTVARSPNVESKQRIALRSSFSDITIKREGLDIQETGPALIDRTELFQEVVSHEKPVTPGAEIAVEAAAGDVRIEGVDEDVLRVTATKFVRMSDNRGPQAALEAIAAEVTEEGGRLVVRTRAVGDMGALGCSVYRIDLAIQCPRTSRIAVQAADGHTTVAGTGEAVQAVQTAGAITVEHAKGTLALTNDKGDIQVTECAGPIEVNAKFGNVHLNEVYGSVSVTSEEGRIVLEALHAGVVVRNRGGSVRIIALDGVDGNYDVLNEEGDVSMLLPASADAAFHVIAEGGHVYSAIPLNGAINQDMQEFHGRLKDGLREVTLKTKNGDIRIN